jgi:hypothetical protein
LIEGGEDLVFKWQALEDSLDHHHGIGDTVGNIGAGVDATQDLISSLSSELLPGYASVQEGADRVDASVDQFLGGVDQGHSMSGFGRHLGDSSAHRAGTDNCNL